MANMGVIKDLLETIGWMKSEECCLFIKQHFHS